MGRGGALTEIGRLLVVGIPCSGKSTFARAVAAAWDVPHVEVDCYRYGPGWVTPPDFPQVIDDLTCGPTWVVDDFGGDDVRDLLWSRADRLVWLDPPRYLAQYRALRRTVWWMLTRKRIAGGNRETITSWLGADHPVRFVWSRHASARAEMEIRLADRRWEGLEVSRVHHRRDVTALLAELVERREQR